MLRNAPLVGLVVVVVACAAPAAFPPGPPASETPARVLAFPQAPAPPGDEHADDDAGTAPTRAQQDAWARRAEELVRNELHPRARVCLAPTLNAEPDSTWRAHFAIGVAPNGAVTEARVVECVELMQSECECIATAARSLHFAPPGSAGARLDARFDLRTLR